MFFLGVINSKKFRVGGMLFSGYKKTSTSDPYFLAMNGSRVSKDYFLVVSD